LRRRLLFARESAERFFQKTVSPQVIAMKGLKCGREIPPHRGAIRVLNCRQENILPISHATPMRCDA
jgi:hypothetical protein